MGDSCSNSKDSSDDNLDANTISPYPPFSQRPQPLPRWNNTPGGSEYYDMTNKERGVALILNHEHFKSQKSRAGTDVDCKNMTKCLKELGFNVIVANDLNYSDVMANLDKLSKYDHSDSDCLVIVAMTHGEKGVLYAKDRKYRVEELWEPFFGENCPSLIGKPKLFFINACRGEMLDAGVQPFAAASFDYTDAYSSSNNFTIPTTADILIMFSTYDGHYSWRNPSNGSWFIQALYRELTEHGKVKDLLTMLTGVSRRVAYEYQSSVPGNERMDAMKQMPSIVSMLTKVLYFTKKLESITA